MGSGQEKDLAQGIKIKISNFKKLLGEIARHSNEHKLSETITFIIKASGLEEEFKESKDEGAARLENAYELVNFASKYDSLNPSDAILEFLSDSALQSDQDELKEEGKAVRLMTVHASKGLEFDTIFVSGLEDGLFPHQRLDERAKMKPEEAEEERRLFYVAVTRARKKLFLSYAQTRTVFGRRALNMPSEFISDIPEHLLEEENFEVSGWQRRPLLEIDF